MDRQVEIIGQILFSKSLVTVDPVLIEAFDILKTANCSLTSVIPLCEKTDWTTSVRISQAASVRFLGAPNWLDIVWSHIPHIKTPNALLGITLGIFKGINWYDEEWKTQTEFNKLLPCNIYQLIGCQSDGSKAAKSLLTDSYEAELSVSIKKYVRSDNKEPWQKPDRLVAIALLLNWVREDFDSKKLTLETLSPLGVLILDQLLYALFGNVSVSGRMYAMDYLMNEHIKRIIAKVGVKTS